jgi:hypothetical protein
MWSYEKKRRFDKKGNRWHFVHHYLFEDGVPYDEQPFEVYFRDADRTTFGVLRFERRKDNPYRDYETMVNRIMNNEKFRKSLIAPGAKAIWSKNWK